MTTKSSNGHGEGVEFVVEDDGSITARDLETGLSRGGQTRAEALTQLAEVLTLYEGGGEPIEDEDAFLRDIGIDPEDVEQARAENEPPDFAE